MKFVQFGQKVVNLDNLCSVYCEQTFNRDKEWHIICDFTGQCRLYLEYANQETCLLDFKRISEGLLAQKWE